MTPRRGVPTPNEREGGKRVIDEAPTSRLASDPTTWLSAGFFTTVIAAHALGLLGVVTYPLVIVGGIVCACVGVRRHRPSVRWPWWAMVVSGLLWAVAGVVREATEATGDLTVSRSLLPDLFALPGYVLFGLALYGLLRARRAPDESGHCSTASCSVPARCCSSTRC